MATVIIGGGWSGLAAAITLVQQGHQVQLLESAKQLGGRARNVQWQGHTIDNGQHLMIGAYDRMLAMMKIIGIDANKAFKRLPMDIEILDKDYSPLCLSTKGLLPWPLSLAWNLFNSAGLSGLYKVSKLQSAIPKLLAGNDISVEEWLEQTKQPHRLITQLWEPLCLATLNTPIHTASAHILARVLQDSLGKGQSAADSLIPAIPLGDLFPLAAAKYIKQHGGTISLQSRVTKIIIEHGKATSVLTQNGDTIQADNIIVALSPSQTVDLLAEDIELTRPSEYPICTVYLQYPQHTRLAKPMFGLTGTISQWIFDRSDQTPGLMAVVISAPGSHESMTNPTLIKQVCSELHQLLPFLPPTVDAGFVIREKRATFSSDVNIEKQRPTHQTKIIGLSLAGDFVSNDYPATLEGAIRNGENSALSLLKLV